MVVGSSRNDNGGGALVPYQKGCKGSRLVRNINKNI